MSVRHTPSGHGERGRTGCQTPPEKTGIECGSTVGGAHTDQWVGYTLISGRGKH